METMFDVFLRQKVTLH